MKLNRRNFIKTIGATIAAAATRKWPAINWPEPVRRAATNPDDTVLDPGFEVWRWQRRSIFADDADPILDLQRKMGDAARITLEKQLGIHTE